MLIPTFTISLFTLIMLLFVEIGTITEYIYKKIKNNVHNRIINTLVFIMFIIVIELCYYFDRT